MNKAKILNKHQFDFRKNHSTNFALIDIVNKITKPLDNNELATRDFLDNNNQKKTFGVDNNNINNHDNDNDNDNDPHE